MRERQAQVRDLVNDAILELQELLPKVDQAGSFAKVAELANELQQVGEGLDGDTQELFWQWDGEA